MSEPREPRQKAQRKPRTASGQIKGRRPGRSGAELPPVEPEAPRSKRHFVRLRDPGYVLDPVTGEEIARRFGPGVPVFERGPTVMGRPPVKLATELLWIVRAATLKGKGQEELSKLAQQIYDFAHGDGATAVRKGRLVAPVGEGQSVEAVERRLKETLKKIAERNCEREKAKKEGTYRWIEFDGTPGDTSDDTTT